MLSQELNDLVSDSLDHVLWMDNIP
jgi:hypothetical protein